MNPQRVLPASKLHTTGGAKHDRSSEQSETIAELEESTMKRSHHYVAGSLAVRLASAAGALALSAATLATLVGAMAPTGRDVEYAIATDVTVVPSRIEVVGTRAPTTVRSVAAPHVG